MESIPYQLSDIDKLLRELYQLKKMNQMLLNEIKRLKEDQFYDESIQPPLKNVNHFDSLHLKSPNLLDSLHLKSPNHFDFLPQQFPR